MPAQNARAWSLRNFFSNTVRRLRDYVFLPISHAIVGLAVGGVKGTYIYDELFGNLTASLFRTPFIGPALGVLAFAIMGIPCIIASAIYGFFKTPIIYATNTTNGSATLTVMEHLQQNAGMLFTTMTTIPRSRRSSTPPLDGVNPKLFRQTQTLPDNQTKALLAAACKTHCADDEKLHLVHDDKDSPRLNVLSGRNSTRRIDEKGRVISESNKGSKVTHEDCDEKNGVTPIMRKK